MDRLDKILSLYHGLMSGLASSALQLSKESQEVASSWQSLPHWKFTRNSILTLKKKYEEGGYEIEGERSFSQSTLLVNDISAVIGINFQDAGRHISDYGAQASRSLAIQAGGILVNVVLIVWISYLFIRSIHQKFDEVITALGQSSEESNHSSTELNDACMRLSSGAQETAASIQETVSSMSEINSMVNSTLEKSKMTTSSSMMVSKMVDRGADTVSRLVEAMDDIRESNERLREVVMS